MAKGVKVTEFLSVRSDQIAAPLAMIPGLQSETLSRTGARSTEVLQNPAAPTKVLFIDEFDSVEASEEHFRWGAQGGDLEKLGALLAESPRIEVWPVSLAPDALPDFERPSGAVVRMRGGVRDVALASATRADNCAATVTGRAVLC